MARLGTLRELAGTRRWFGRSALQHWRVPFLHNRHLSDPWKASISPHILSHGEGVCLCNEALYVHVPRQQFRGSRIVINVDKREIIQTKYIGISQQSISDVQKTTKLTEGSISKIHPTILLCTSPCKYVLEDSVDDTTANSRAWKTRNVNVLFDRRRAAIAGSLPRIGCFCLPAPNPTPPAAELAIFEH